MILVELRENEGVEEKEMSCIEWHTNESLKQLNVKLELVIFFLSIQRMKQYHLNFICLNSNNNNNKNHLLSYFYDFVQFD